METQIRLTEDVPFTLASILLDDSLARLNLAEPGRPLFKILIGCARHEATNVDVGDAFWVLEASC